MSCLHLFCAYVTALKGTGGKCGLFFFCFLFLIVITFQQDWFSQSWEQLPAPVPVRNSLIINSVGIYLLCASKASLFRPFFRTLGSQCKHGRTGCYQSHQTGTGWVIPICAQFFCILLPRLPLCMNTFQIPFLSSYSPFPIISLLFLPSPLDQNPPQVKSQILPSFTIVHLSNRNVNMSALFLLSMAL